jgi:glycine cleavage system H protein
MDTPSELLYSPGHIWVRLEGNRATMGLTDYAQMEWGMIMYVELPEPQSTIEASEIFASIENLEATEDLVSPLSGKVVSVHRELEKEPFLVNTSPYHQGWMIVVELSHPEEVEQLWGHERYMEQYGEIQG